MPKSKKEVVQGLIDANIEDIYKMEVVRDSNKTINPDDPKSKEQVKAAEHQIEKDKVNIGFLEEYIKTCA